LLTKNFIRWYRYRYLELKREIWDHNKFDIFNDELGTGELSADGMIEKFIHTTNSLVKDISISSSK